MALRQEPCQQLPGQSSLRRLESERTGIKGLAFSWLPQILTLTLPLLTEDGGSEKRHFKYQLSEKCLCLNTVPFCSVQDMEALSMDTIHIGRMMNHALPNLSTIFTF